jgi:hypothetical protein
MAWDLRSYLPMWSLLWRCRQALIIPFGIRPLVGAVSCAACVLSVPRALRLSGSWFKDSFLAAEIIYVEASDTEIVWLLCEYWKLFG